MWEEYKDENGKWKVRRSANYEKEVIQGLLKNSNIPKAYQNKKVNDFKADDEVGKKLKDYIIYYVQHFNELNNDSKCMGIYIYSKATGTGKTHLVCSVATVLINKQVVCVFTTLTELLSKVKATFGEGDTLITLEKYKKAKVLIIDDIGSENITDWSNETIFDIVDYREKNLLPTLYTSNCRASELKYDPRIISRIIGNTVELKAPEEDMRLKGV